MVAMEIKVNRFKKYIYLLCATLTREEEGENLRSEAQEAMAGKKELMGCREGRYLQAKQHRLQL